MKDLRWEPPSSRERKAKQMADSKE